MAHQTKSGQAGKIAWLVPGSTESMIGEFFLQVHDSVRSILSSFWGLDADEFEDFLKSEVGGFDFEGKEWKGTGQDEVEALAAQGMWGFCDVPRKVVHIWDMGAVSDSRLMYLIGHELGHLIVGVQHENPDVQEELDADCYGEVASFTFDILSHIRYCGEL